MELTKDQKVVQNMIEKAWSDDAFKQALVDTPQATIESFTGTKLQLPEGTRIVVRDQSDESYTFLNIPRQFNEEELSDMELTDEQLEVVAGGEGAFLVSYVVGTIALALTAYNVGQSHRDPCE